MLHKRLFKITLTVLTAGFFTACLATKPYVEPDIEVDNLYPFQKIALDSTSLANMPWNELFEDPQLQDIIVEALRNNLNLMQAIQQIRISQANYYQGRMALLPSLNLGASASYVKPSENSLNLGARAENITIEPTKQFSVSLQSSWELPIWGKLTSAKKAAYASLLQTQAARRAVRTRLIANVAKTYYQLLALDAQLAIAKETVQNRIANVETITSLKEAALVTGAAVQQNIALRYAAAVLIPDLKQSIIEVESTLSILLGRPPGPVERSSLAIQEPLEAPGSEIGIPATLLRNRPDIIAAEFAFRRAFQLTNNARTYFYPSIRLTAEGGFQSFELTNLLDPASVFYNLIAGLTQPIFNNGINKARLTISEAQQKQALLQLKQTILTAGAEVTDALSRFKKAQQKLLLREKQLDALEKAVNFSQELLRYGRANYIDVLTAQQNLLSAQLNSVNDKLQQLTAGVTLYRALGGGWKSNVEVEEQEIKIEE